MPTSTYSGEAVPINPGASRRESARLSRPRPVWASRSAPRGSRLRRPPAPRPRPARGRAAERAFRAAVSVTQHVAPRRDRGPAAAPAQSPSRRGTTSHPDRGRASRPSGEDSPPELLRPSASRSSGPIAEWLRASLEPRRTKLAPLTERCATTTRAGASALRTVLSQSASHRPPTAIPAISFAASLCSAAPTSGSDTDPIPSTSAFRAISFCSGFALPSSNTTTCHACAIALCGASSTAAAIPRTRIPRTL